MVVAAAGMLLNAAIMAIMTSLLFINYLFSQLIATSLVLMWNFVGNRSWTFNETGKDHY